MFEITFLTVSQFQLTQPKNYHTLIYFCLAKKFACSKIYDLQNTIALDHYTFETRANVVDAHSVRLWRAEKATVRQLNSRPKLCNLSEKHTYTIELLCLCVYSMCYTCIWQRIELYKRMVNIWHLCTVLYIDNNCRSTSILFGFDEP